MNILVGNELLKKKGINPQTSATNDSGDGNSDYSDDDDSDCSDSDYSDNSDGDSNAEVENTDDEESCGTVEYTDDEESVRTIEDTDDEISIGTSGVEEAVGNPGVDTEEGIRRSSRYRQVPERFAADTSYYKANENKKSVTSKTSNDG